MALALALTGGCFSEIEEGSAQVDVHLVEPGGLGFEMSVAGKERDEYSLLLDAELTNLGTEACHLAIFLHTSEPVPEDIPFLTGPPAPANFRRYGGCRCAWRTASPSPWWVRAAPGSPPCCA